MAGANHLPAHTGHAQCKREMGRVYYSCVHALLRAGHQHAPAGFDRQQVNLLARWALQQEALAALSTQGQQGASDTGASSCQVPTSPQGPGCSMQLSSAWPIPHAQHHRRQPALHGQLPASSHSSIFSRGLKVLRRTYDLPPTIASVLQQELQKAQEKPVCPHIPKPSPRPLQRASRRAGCIAYKMGMTQEWDEHGVRVPLTVLWIDDCQVVGHRWPALHGYWAMQIAAGHKQQTNLHPGQVGFYLKQGVPLKAMMAEFKVSADGMLPVGTAITAAHFRAGQHVDVTGWTKNKGFQGVMKRWGFKGLPATHGVSLAHRSPGSIGNRTSPGKVWKGKKMPGQMGDEKRTVHNVFVYKVDSARNLLYVRGQVPGPAGQEVLLRDAYNTRHADRLKWGLPFPTHCGQGGAMFADVGRAGMVLTLAAAQGEELSDEARALLRTTQHVPKVKVATNRKKPYLPYEKETDYFEVKWKKGE